MKPLIAAGLLAIGQPAPEFTAKNVNGESVSLADFKGKQGNKASHFLIDADGAIGKACDAKVTPHMFIIDKNGNLACDGAIDSKATADAADIAAADKFFGNALEAVLAGKKAPNAKNKPHGCGVKY